MNSDEINRKRIRFTVGALHDAAFESSRHGIPALVGHDALRPIGWIFPYGLYLEPGLTRLVGEQQLAENDVDFDKIYEAYRVDVHNRFYDECAPHRVELNELLKENQSENNKYHGMGCAACIDDNIVDRIYPFLKEWEDKDHLIPLSKLLTVFEYLGQGVFKDKTRNLTIFCHPFLRRSLSRLNNVNFDFIAEFMDLRDDDILDLRLAFDSDAIGLASSFHAREELEYVFGPKYSDTLEDIKPGVSRLDSDATQKFFSQVSRTEFWWKDDENTKVLEVEELRDNPTKGSSSNEYGCRYIHTIYTPETKKFHFDGAIRTYDTEGLITRLDVPMNRAGKNTRYKKLFRVDGYLQIDRWKLLITYFFSGNPLIYEYFGMKEEHENLFESGMPVLKETALQKYVPYNINPSDGVRLFVSYHPFKEDNTQYQRKVIHPDSLTMTNGKGRIEVNVIDFRAIEIKKALERAGEELYIPETIKFVNCFDNTINFPTIRHSSKDTTRLLRETISAYRAIFNKVLSRNPMVSFTLAWALEDKEVRLSAFGRVSELLRWLDESASIPENHEDFKVWVEKQSAWLGQTYDTKTDSPHIFDLISGDGVISIGRQMINSNWTDFSETETGELKCELTLPVDEADLMEAIDNKEIGIAACYLVKKVRCSKTGEDYLHSKTSKILDDDVRAEVLAAGHPFGTWTA